MKLLLQKRGTSVRLAQELGRGGEGAVFAIGGRNDLVAKMYLAAPDVPKVQKLLAMVDAANSSLLNIAAWPIDLAIDANGKVRGVVMPRVSTRRDIHELYGPKSRAEAFPEADFRFLVHVATNVARAFAVVHEQRHVVGDVNHGNLLVAANGTVMFIDCDSFQVMNGAQVFPCDVGVPLFTPPELHGLAFRGLHRVGNHDRFGLAVLVFHLLYMGRHPFAGRYNGTMEMPIERAIREHRFAYGPDRSLHGMERPPGTIPLETMGPSIAHLFSLAFGRDAASSGRPDARVWVEALVHLGSSLKNCSRANSHQYPTHLSSCPWCAIEEAAGVRMFGQRMTVPGPVGAVDLATLWQSIASVPNPGPDPVLPSQRVWTPPVGLGLRRLLKFTRKTTSLGLVAVGVVACSTSVEDSRWMIVLLSYGLAYAIWPRPSPLQLSEADQSLSSARAVWDTTLGRWKRDASRETFTSKLKELEQSRAALTDLPNERLRRLARLEAEREQRQRDRYLDRFRIDRARIRGIGVGRSTMLAAYGIETAADVDRWKLLQVPGIGHTLAGELISWRHIHEQHFRFNPHDPLHAGDAIALDRELELRRQASIEALRQGPAILGRLAREIGMVRPRLLPALEHAWNRLMLAKWERESL